MKTIGIGGLLLALSAGAPALAQMGPPDPFGDRTVTKSDIEAQAVARFTRFDSNKDGSLSLEERRAGAGGGPGGARGPGGPGGPGATGPVNQVDFVAAQVRRFEAQDTDKNGQLTKAERDAFRQQMRQRAQPAGETARPY